MKRLLVMSLILVSMAGCGERYKYQYAGNNAIFKIDRFTGNVWFIYGNVQSKVEKDKIDPEEVIWDKPEKK